MTHPVISKALDRSDEEADQAGLLEDRLRAKAVQRKRTSQVLEFSSGLFNFCV
jgi:hypothetical protein